MRIDRKVFLIFVLILQFLFLETTILDWLGFDMPFTRQVTGFLLVTVLLGYLALRILRKEIMGLTRVALYSVGLSLSLLMFLSLFMNYIYPFLGIERPISTIPLILTINGVLLILLCTFYFRNTEFQINFDVKEHNISCLISPLILPIACIIGVVLLYYYSNNIILLILLLAISIVPLLVSFDILPNKIYPFFIWVISLSLTLYNSLPTQFMRATDNLNEYFLIKQVINNGFWNPDIVIHNINAMPGIVLIPAVYSNILGVDLVSFYKYILPILSSLIPLGLYEVYRQKWNENIAFFASFFYLSLFTFFGWGSITMKMVPSGIFFVLLVMIGVMYNRARVSDKLILLVFLSSLAISHYGTSYVFILALIFATTILYLLGSCTEKNKVLTSPGTLIFFGVFTLWWYIYTTKSVTFESILTIGQRAVNSILTEFVIPEKSYGTALLIGQAPLTLEILKFLYLISGFFITVGLFHTLKQELLIRKKLSEYVALSLPFLVFMCTPYLIYVGQYEVRIWYIASILLAPFLPLGISRFFHFFKIKVGCKRVISIFLIIFFIFNTGLAQEVIFRENYGPINYIGKERILNSGDIYEKARFYELYIEMGSVISAKWLINTYDNNFEKIFADSYSSGLLFYFPGNVLRKVETPFLEKYPRITSLTERTKPVEGSYIYLHDLNLIEGVVITQHRRSAGDIYPNFTHIKEFFPLLNKYHKVYSNGVSSIYCK